MSESLKAIIVASIVSLIGTLSYLAYDNIIDKIEKLESKLAEVENEHKSEIREFKKFSNDLNQRVTLIAGNVQGKGKIELPDFLEKPLPSLAHSETDKSEKFQLIISENTQLAMAQEILSNAEKVYGPGLNYSFYTSKLKLEALLPENSKGVLSSAPTNSSLEIELAGKLFFLDSGAHVLIPAFGNEPMPVSLEANESFIYPYDSGVWNRMFTIPKSYTTGINITF